MCGRYGLFTPLPVVAETLQAELRLTDPGPRYNAAPGQVLPVCRQPQADRRELVGLEWGLVPAWSRNPEETRSRYSLINARAETAADKPAFREAFRRRRAVIPADGFYEWQATGGGAKQPYWIRRRDGGLLALAGLWERWQAPDGEQALETFTIVVGEPNAVLAPIHDRMPVILDAASREVWLDPADREPERLRSLLTPYPADALEAVPVSSRVNSPANDDPAVLEGPEGDSPEGGTLPLI
jgi:putative SOS response-associated peptidase YedK